jgi:hypothetical protein
MLLLARYQRQHITLVGRAVDLIKDDDGFKDFASRAKAAILNGASSYQDPGSVELGGKRNSFGNLLDFAVSPVLGVVTNIGTLKTASNELTWMLRHVTITATPYYVNGNLAGINYHLYDQFDLSGNSNRSAGYNIISNTLGGVYHGLMQYTAPTVDADWTILNR